MVIEISIKSNYENPFLELSTHFAKKTVHRYCSSINDYLIIPEWLSVEKKRLVKKIFDQFENLIIKEINGLTPLTFISIDCPCFDQKFRLRQTQKIREMHAVTIYPITYQEGYEYYKVFLKNEEFGRKFVLDMEKELSIEILSFEVLEEDLIISPASVLKQLMEQLTPLQTETLIQAFEGGYYNIPRHIRTIEMAERNGKTRYAIDKTLRSAENKILNYIMPFIYLQQSTVHIKPCVIEKLPEESKSSKKI